MSQMVDSQEQQLTTDEIVRIAAQEIKSPVPYDKLYTSIIAEFGMEGCRPYRFGNTLFIIHETNPGQGIFRALNADTGKNYIDNARQFFNKAKEDGYKILVVQFTDPTILNIFSVLGREFIGEGQSGVGYIVQKSKDGKKYQVTLALG
jgi:hypothetical protein